MSYVLITVFGLTDKQVQEIERNDGFTNADVKQWNDDLLTESEEIIWAQEDI